MKILEWELEYEKLDTWKFPALIANYFNMWKLFLFQNSTCYDYSLYKLSEFAESLEIFNLENRN